MTLTPYALCRTQDKAQLLSVLYFVPYTSRAQDEAQLLAARLGAPGSLARRQAESLVGIRYKVYRAKHYKRTYTLLARRQAESLVVLLLSAFVAALVLRAIRRCTTTDSMYILSVVHYILSEGAPRHCVRLVPPAAAVTAS